MLEMLEPFGLTLLWTIATAWAAALQVPIAIAQRHPTIRGACYALLRFQLNFAVMLFLPFAALGFAIIYTDHLNPWPDAIAWAWQLSDERIILLMVILVVLVWCATAIAITPRGLRSFERRQPPLAEF